MINVLIFFYFIYIIFLVGKSCSGHIGINLCETTKNMYA